MIRSTFRAAYISAVVGLFAGWCVQGFHVEAQTIKSPSSWYGGPCDSGDNDIPAYGKLRWNGSTVFSNKVPGIALRTPHTARSVWLLTAPNGRRVVVIHSDYGPAAHTGKGVDVNYTAAIATGYGTGGGCAHAYPTGRRVKITQLKSRSRAEMWILKTRTRYDDKRTFTRLVHARFP